MEVGVLKKYEYYFVTVGSDYITPYASSLVKNNTYLLSLYYCSFENTYFSINGGNFGKEYGDKIVPASPAMEILYGLDKDE